MKLEQFRNLIKEEIQKVLSEANEFGAFRRLVITSAKVADIQKEIQAFMDRPNIKSDYPMNKFSIKPGAKPSTIVIDIEGTSGTALSKKLQDLAKKLDKTASVKEKKELKLKAVK